MLARTQRPPLFPYTTLFRSPADRREKSPGGCPPGNREADAAPGAQPSRFRRDRDPAHLPGLVDRPALGDLDRKSTRLNSSHLVISYAVFCLQKKTQEISRRD